MATIHFSSGKVREIGIQEFMDLPPKLQQRGIRTMVDRTPERTLLIPLNSNTMEFIEEIHEVIEVEEVEEAPVTEVTLEDLKEELEVAKEEVDSKKDIEEKRKEQMDDMMAKSNCQHEDSKMVIYRHDTKKGSRFFPVCSFCGKRERYVKAESLSDEVKAAAAIWED